ncbi:MAG TPA: hypothetical protein VK886_14700 [Vicinamibacterales bacterium]|nr:hypothetical protein [Vicinamibacterales bacterium]
MTLRFGGLSLLLVVAACRGTTAPSDGTTPGNNGSFEGGAIATTHLFGDAPDKTTVFGPVISVVGPGVELRNFGVTVFVNGQPMSGFVNVDFSAANILITLVRDQSFGYHDSLRFADPDGTLRDFAGVQVHPATDYSGFTPSRIRVDADAIDVNLTGLRGLRGQAIHLDVTLVAR